MNRGVQGVVSALLGVQLVALPIVARAADPQCFAASTDGQQLALEGKLKAAREKLAACAASSCPKEVADDCADRLAKIDADLPSIVVVAKDASGAPANIARLAIDGADATVPVDGKPIALDPGGHDVHVEIAGTPPFDQHIELARGKKGVVVEVVAKATMATEPPTSTEQPAGPASDASSSRKSIPTATWILGGVGVVGLACFAGFGIAALKQSSDLHDSPPGSYTVDDVDALKRKRLLADVSLGVGVVALAAAAVVWFAQPSPTRKDAAAAVDVRIVTGGAVAAFGGAF